jgi:modulator of FtsH protease
MHLDDWAAFFTGAVGAAAALVGLLIVAMSVNIKAIVAIPGMPSRAGSAIADLMAVLVTSALALIPRLDPFWFAVIAAIVSAGGLGFAVQSAVQLYRGGRRGATARSAVGLAPMLAALAGAVLLLVGIEAGMLVIALGFAAAFIVAVLNSWVLLVEILR